MKLKTVAMTGVLSLAGLGLIGAGAHAAFTSSPTSAQSLTASSISVVTWSANDTSTPPCQTEAEAISNDCTSVTLPTETVLSTFDTTPQTVYVYNDSSVNVYETNFAMTLGYNNLTFVEEAGLCSYSDGTVLYNGLISGAQGSTLYNPGDEVVSPDTTDSYVMEFYAGEPSVTCGTNGESAGAPVTAADSLTNGAEGGSLTATFTLSISDTI